MSIKTKLKNPEHCEGCPYLRYWEGVDKDDWGFSADMFFARCTYKNNKYLLYFSMPNSDDTSWEWFFKCLFRPKQCIKENGR